MRKVPLMNDIDVDERRRQIERLLTFPKVGPLSAAAIAANLATGESEILAALKSLVQEGRIMHMEEGRFTGAPKRPARTRARDRRTDGETGQRR
jgi:predicted ArsR family transcriptional regulator